MTLKKIWKLTWPALTWDKKNNGKTNAENRKESNKNAGEASAEERKNSSVVTVKISLADAKIMMLVFHIGFLSVCTLLTNQWSLHGKLFTWEVHLHYHLIQLVDIRAMKGHGHSEQGDLTAKSIKIYIRFSWI